MSACGLDFHIQGMQGRFSGRLEAKADEKLLLDECKLVGPLLGGAGKRGDQSRQTLAKIVRGIADGEIRRHCQAREERIQVCSFPISGLLVRGGRLSHHGGKQSTLVNFRGLN